MRGVSGRLGWQCTEGEMSSKHFSKGQSCIVQDRSSQDRSQVVLQVLKTLKWECSCSADAQPPHHMQDDFFFHVDELRYICLLCCQLVHPEQSCMCRATPDLAAALPLWMCRGWSCMTGSASQGTNVRPLASLTQPSA